MRKLILILFSSLLGCNGNAQTDTNVNMVQPDLELGNYGISFKNKTIGLGQSYGCSDTNYHATCFGYFKIDNIDFDGTTLYFIGNEIKFKEDLGIDLATFKIIDAGNDSSFDNKKRSGLYIDKNYGYKSLYKDDTISSLDGFNHLEQGFLSRGNNLAYLDNQGLYFLTKTEAIDLKTFKAIAKNIFYDKNGVYYVEYGHSEIKEKKYSDIVKLQGLKTNKKPSIEIHEHYIIINKKVYDINRLENELLLDHKNINKIILHNYYGEMLLFDDKKVYIKGSTFAEATCEDELDGTEIECLFDDLSDIQLLRETGFTEYHLDYDNKILYYDADKNLELTETSGNLYKIGKEFYFDDSDRFSLKLNAVKIWNPTLDDYEDIDLSNYQYINDENYCYKGDLYGHHSELKQANFSQEQARVLLTDKWVYIVNKDLIIDLKESENLNLKSLKVLKTAANEDTNYLVGDDYLIYNNQIIEGIKIKEIIVLNKDVLKTNTHLINKGNSLELSKFPFKIEIIQ